MKSPSPTEIREARADAGLTQVEAAVKADVTVRAWQYYEKGDRKMPGARFELFLIKTGQKPVN